MRSLIDTHTLLWFLAGDHRLSNRARKIIEEPGVDSFVSIASCWEITIKSSQGRLELEVPLEQLFFETIPRSGLSILDIARRHLIELANLPPTHRDPFDRILVAQAKVEGLALLSNDGALDAYGVRRVW